MSHPETGLDVVSLSRLARILRERGSCARLLRVQLRRDSGSIQRAAITLRQHTDDSRLLVQELQRLLASLLLPTGDRPAEAPLGGIDELRVTLGDFAPDLPSQGAFWRTRDERLVALQVVADGLARRHGRPLLLRPILVQSAAIFGEERQRLLRLDGEEAAQPPRREQGVHAGDRDVGDRRRRPLLDLEGDGHPVVAALLHHGVHLRLAVAAAPVEHADAQDVAEAVGDQQRGRKSLALDQRVGDDRSYLRLCVFQATLVMSGTYSRLLATTPGAR